MPGSRKSSIVRQDVFEKFRAVPIYETLSYEFLELDNGRCRLRMPLQQPYTGSFRSFHGGLLMTVADSAAYCAVMTLAGTRLRAPTADMNIRFLEPCLSDATAEAEVIRYGNTLCPVAVDLWDTSQRRVAVAQVNFVLLEK